MVKERREIPHEDLWNVEGLFPSFDSWQKEFQIANREDKKPRWPEIAAFKGKLGDGPEALKAALELTLSTGRNIEKLYTYAHLRHDEDIANDQFKTAFSRITMLIHDFAQECAWFEPELISLPEKKIQEYLKSPVLADYRFHLEKIVRIKKHTLSEEKEELMALAGKAMQTPHKAFSAINDADFQFGTTLDSKGNPRELTHATYGMYIREHDRTLRENAFKNFHGKFYKYENTLCELLNGQVQNHLFNTRARNYSSCLEAAMFPKNIDTSVYHALVQAVNEEIGALHKYIALRQHIMNVGPLHPYDMNVPLTSDIDIKMTYKQAEEIVIESVKPLGTEYQNLLKKGFQEQRWVDRYENKSKRSGAYSSGCYDSMPYILMNYKEVLKDVFTLAHEAGHSMHSLLSHKHQPYQYGDYPIFLAEVASTFNEEMLMRLMLERAQSKEEKIYLINQKIEDIRGTLFRQTMFAEFELLVHELAEKNTPLTPKLLKEEYRKLNAKYFGPEVDIDSEAEVEWARIPHFYYNFYVYQYATGISAALALAERVVKGGNAEREAYLSFLNAGCSRYPIEILQMAGVDMRTPQPVKAAIGKFSGLVDQLAELLPKKETIKAKTINDKR
jgi:oligoendopeptidase F